MGQDENVIFQEPFDDEGDVLDCLATYKRNYLSARTNYNFSPVTSQQNKTKQTTTRSRGLIPLRVKAEEILGSLGDMLGVLVIYCILK